MGLFSLEPESSPELLLLWLLLQLLLVLLLVSEDSGFRGTWLGPVRPEKDPDELELVLAAGARVVRNGDTGEPRSSSRKSGLLMLPASLLQLSAWRNRSAKASTPEECDIVSEQKGGLKIEAWDEKEEEEEERRSLSSLSGV